MLLSLFYSVIFFHSHSLIIKEIGNICTKEPIDIMNTKDKSQTPRKRSSSMKETKNSGNNHVTYNTQRNTKHHNTEKYSPMKTQNIMTKYQLIKAKPREPFQNQLQK